MREHQISATEFKAKCLRLLDDVANTGRAIVVTKHGKPIARVTKTSPANKPAMGGLAGSSEEAGDIVYFDTTNEWECLK
jgi:prevent-host-death family protein